MSIKKAFILFVMILCWGGIVFAKNIVVEKSLGGVSIGDSYNSVRKKYPVLKPVNTLEEVSLPYPLNVLDKDSVYLAQDPSLDLVVYLAEDSKKVKALVTFLYREEDTKNYETSAGLRVADSIIAAKLLYGEPVKKSTYVYFYPENRKVEENIYYFENLCLHTQVIEGNEFITSIVVGKYDVEKTMTAIQAPLPKGHTVLAKELSPQSVLEEEKVKEEALAAKKEEKKTVVPEKAKTFAIRLPFIKKKEDKKEEISEESSAVQEELASANRAIVKKKELPRKAAVVKKPVPVKEVAVQQRAVEKKAPEILMGEKIEVAQRVKDISADFLVLISSPTWNEKIKYDDKMEILSITNKMTREDIDTLKNTAEAASYGKILDNLYLQF